MTYQEILEGITRHRSNEANISNGELKRKFQEIEWGLQAIAEKLRDSETHIMAATKPSTAPPAPAPTAKGAFQ